MQYISTVDMTREEWLATRSSLGIGGSDVAAVLGLSKFKSRYQVWLDKTGQLTEELPENDAMKAGRKLEPVIADWYEEFTGKKVVKDNKIRIHQDHPFLIANIDRLIMPQNGEGRGILEIKTTNGFYFRRWEDAVPLEYYYQLQHYLNVCDSFWGEFAILVDGRHLNIVPIERDQATIDAMTELLTRFWNENVLCQIPPEPLNVEEVDAIYKAAQPGMALEADSKTEDAYHKLLSLKSDIKLLEAEAESYELAIKQYMGEAEFLMSSGNPLATWKSVTSNRFDTTEFKKYHPDLYDKYINTTNSRRFTLKGRS